MNLLSNKRFSIINMPPAYGKTEIFARSLIPFKLGKDRTLKVIYISYSDELCSAIALEVRNTMKSNFYRNIFGKVDFIQEKSTGFTLKEGGGLFCTTLKSEITGHHGDIIIIDDPIKVSNMTSKAERDAVNRNFRESIISRLRTTDSKIIIIMQRLSEDDLVGFVQNPRYFERSAIDSWEIIKLEAISKENITRKIDNFEWTQIANKPLFPELQNTEYLNHLKLQLGNDVWSTQYLQDPQVSESGYFELSNWRNIGLSEINDCNDYIFIDHAESMKESADNRAVICMGVDIEKDNIRFILKDCFFGTWSLEDSIKHIINMMILYPKAKVYIEGEGGGITLNQVLQRSIIKENQALKERGKDIIGNQIELYAPSRKISKIEKIASIRPYFNTGSLCFLNTARGKEQIIKELGWFNPSKPFRRDDCIDAIASCITHKDIKAPYEAKNTNINQLGLLNQGRVVTWRI